MKSRHATRIFRILSEQSGFTLVEILVAVGILTVIAGIMVTSTAQIYRFQRTWAPDILATRDVRGAGSYFAGDALNTETTTLTDLAFDNSSTTLHWSDISNVGHRAKYYLSGAAEPYKLMREYDGAAIQLTDKVVSVKFSRSGKTITFDLVVQAGDSTASTTITTFLRNSQ